MEKRGKKAEGTKEKEGGKTGDGRKLFPTVSALLRLLPKQRALTEESLALSPSPCPKLASQALPCLCPRTEAGALAHPAPASHESGAGEDCLGTLPTSGVPGC